jgi:zinc D-Ala-D-Ala dipeptidase
MRFLIFSIFFLLCFTQCHSNKTMKQNNTVAAPTGNSMDSARKELPFEEEFEAENGFVELITLDASILIDIKYATTDNFVKEKMYNCGRCFLRPEVAAAIVLAHKKLQKKGLGLKIFDGYRPRPFQQRLWDKVPDDRFVTNPKKGSMHNRGAAVDLTIVDKKGKELDMGTPFDFFGEKAYQTCTDLPKNVLDNRKLLRETLAEFGFKHIRTEWWHYSYTQKKYALSDWLWDCK